MFSYSMTFNKIQDQNINSFQMSLISFLHYFNFYHNRFTNEGDHIRNNKYYCQSVYTKAKLT